MKNTNLTELREKLAEYIRYVAGGGTVMIWKHDKAVAKIISAYSEKPSKEDSEFQEQIARGLIRPPEEYSRTDVTGALDKAPKVRKNPSDIIFEEREKGL